MQAALSADQQAPRNRNRLGRRRRDSGIPPFVRNDVKRGSEGHREYQKDRQDDFPSVRRNYDCLI